MICIRYQGTILLIIKCLGVYLFWLDQGWYHAERMFLSEIDNFSSTFTQSLMVNNPLQLLISCYHNVMTGFLSKQA